MRKFQREREGKTIGIWLCERSSHFHATILVCHSFLGDLIEREEEREREMGRVVHALLSVSVSVMTLDFEWSRGVT